jgi:hypothetical protein
VEIRKQLTARVCGVRPSERDALRSITRFLNVHPETCMIVVRKTQVGKGSRSDLHCTLK